MIQLTLDPPLLGLKLINEFKRLSKLFKVVNAKIFGALRGLLGWRRSLVLCGWYLTSTSSSPHYDPIDGGPSTVGIRTHQCGQAPQPALQGCQCEGLSH
ncbi:hypothetical protein FRX31_005166 [Thalictrum thalictroides]|uniref:Uncharacterized protein n=1 Tax=Thalictrum thalictroides TaxID=46969 RepID=A0A7J6X8C2_THATH|nr:hypothetical protein FRX31_005166 [Thalictrum thalictroides]